MRDPDGSAPAHPAQSLTPDMHPSPATTNLAAPAPRWYGIILNIT
jgi:hypothetical protein